LTNLANSKRLLPAGVPYGPNCVVSGNGTVKVMPFVNQRVEVIARDSFGVALTTGGAHFRIEIYNECNPTSDYQWVEVGGAIQVLSSPIISDMQDNGDGTYYYDYTLTREGPVIVQVILLTNGLTMNCYPNPSWSGSPTVSTSVNNLDIQWGQGSPFSQNDYFSWTFIGYFQSPTTETYRFTGIWDDSWNMIIEGQTLMNHNQWGSTSGVSTSSLTLADRSCSRSRL
jgi:hypothetical protein